MGLIKLWAMFSVETQLTFLVITMHEIKSVSMSEMKSLKNWFATILKDKESIYNL